MADKANSFEILVDGKVYRFTGEDPEYMQKLSSYLNRKIKECRNSPGYRSFDGDYREVLLNLNICDDYFKAAQEKEKLLLEKEEMEKELYALRHETVTLKMKLENAGKQQKELETELRKRKETSTAQQRGDQF